MAGTDIKISGNVNQTFRGLIAAAEQFDITGNPTLEAAILSGGQDNSATNDSDLVVSNLLSGSMTVCYDGTLAMPPAGNATGVLDVLSWQELEIARGTDVFAPQN
jgi:hypothetical protein